MLTYASEVLLLTALVTASLVAVAARLLVRAPISRPDPGSPHVRSLAFNAALCVIIALVALAIFVEVADNVMDRDELAQLDGRVTAALSPWRGSGNLRLAQLMSFAGTVPVMSTLALLVTVTLLRVNWRAIAVGWTVVMGGGLLVEQALKETFRRTRPFGADHYIVTPSYSYPSGHSMGAMIGYGMIAYLMLRRTHHPLARAVVTLSAAAVIISVALSRLVLGVHFFTDVVGGIAAGAVWLTLSLAAVEAERHRRAVTLERAA